VNDNWVLLWLLILVSTFYSLSIVTLKFFRSKRLWLDGFQKLGSVLTLKELSDLQEVMRDKELNIRTDIYEILLEDETDTWFCINLVCIKILELPRMMSGIWLRQKTQPETSELITKILCQSLLAGVKSEGEISTLLETSKRGEEIQVRRQLFDFAWDAKTTRFSAGTFKSKDARTSLMKATLRIDKITRRTKFQRVNRQLRPCSLKGLYWLERGVIVNCIQIAKTKTSINTSSNMYRTIKEMNTTLHLCSNLLFVWLIHPTSGVHRLCVRRPLWPQESNGTA